MRGANPVWADSLLALVIMVASLLGLRADPTRLNPTLTDALAVVLVVVGIGVIAVRHRNPLFALWVAMAATSVSAIRDYLETGLPIAVIITFYAAASLVPRRKWLPAAGVIVGFLLFMAVFRGEDLSAGNLVVNFAIYGIAAAFGDSNATRRAKNRALEERAETVEQNQAILAEQAVAEERLRIARQSTTSWPTPSPSSPSGPATAMSSTRTRPRPSGSWTTSTRPAARPSTRCGACSASSGARTAPRWRSPRRPASVTSTSW